MIEFTKAAGSGPMEIAPPLFYALFTSAYSTYTGLLALAPSAPFPVSGVVVVFLQGLSIAFWGGAQF